MSGRSKHKNVAIHTYGRNFETSERAVKTEVCSGFLTRLGRTSALVAADELRSFWEVCMAYAWLAHFLYAGEVLDAGELFWRRKDIFCVFGWLCVESGFGIRRGVSGYFCEVS
jgi:hypothetical protein